MEPELGVAKPSEAEVSLSSMTSHPETLKDAAPLVEGLKVTSLHSNIQISGVMSVLGCCKHVN